MMKSSNQLLTAVALMLIRSALGILDAEHLPAESKLKSDLLRHYDPSVRPVYNSTTSINVKADIALQQIIDVNEKLQILRATFWMRLYWKDEFLQWNVSDYDGIKSVKINPSEVWLPDVCLYKALKPAIHANEMRDFLLSVSNSGDIMWLSPIVVDSVCPFNVRYFPYDTQFCTITIGSWMYHGLEVDMTNVNDQGDSAEFKDNVEWEVKRFPAKKMVTIFNCCPEPYPYLDYTLVLKRRPGYYVTYLYVPSVVIILACLFSFHLPPGSDAKVDLSVTGLLSQTVFLLLISELMPPDAFNPPILGTCLSILLIVQAVAVVVNVVIKRIHDDAIHKNEPPKPWMFTLMHYLKYPFFLHHIDYKKHKVSDSQEKLTKADGCENLKVSRTSLETPTAFKPSKTFYGSSNPKMADNMTPTLMLPGAVFNIDHEISTGKVEDKVAHESLKKKCEILKKLDCILEELQSESERVRDGKLRDEITDQWRHIAAMYDRILMVIFMLGVIGISIWFVTLSPNDEEQML